MLYNKDSILNSTGFYFLKEKKITTFSKFEALLHTYNDSSFNSSFQKRTKHENDIIFVFNDDIYDQFDWTIEPSESIDLLYQQRAEFLRNEYDYIRLFFSGGIDSSNILDTFINNKIFIDEVCILTTYDTTDKNSLFNKEPTNRAIPYLKYLENTNLIGKLNIVNIGTLITEIFSNDVFFETYHAYINGSTPWIIAMRSYLLEEKLVTPENKKTCNLWGYEKPAILFTDNGYKNVIADTMMDLTSRNYVNMKVQNNRFSNITNEAFYISRNFAKIVIKQSHLLVNFLKTINSNNNDLVSENELPNTGPFVQHSSYKYLTKKRIDEILYPSQNVNMFTNDKLSSSAILSKRDFWFLKSNNPAAKRITHKINFLIKNYPFMFYYRNGIPYNFVSILTKSRLIST